MQTWLLLSLSAATSIMLGQAWETQMNRKLP